jgi:hypothetical protein
MTIQKHIHRLQRHRYKTGAEVFFCTLDCTFKIDTAFAVGKNCICNLCGREFILDESTIRLKRPHCSNCSKIKVIDPITGKKTYVRKNLAKTNFGIMEELAVDTTRELAERLATVIREVPDEDIV